MKENEYSSNLSKAIEKLREVNKKRKKKQRTLKSPQRGRKQ